MIGMGRRHVNLYVLNSSSFSLQSNFNQNSIFSGNLCNLISLFQKDLWHCRLGHPSFVKIQILRNELNINENFYCDDSHYSICH